MTTQLTEKQYRALDIDSYSSIKTFLENRKKYYRRFILKENIRDNISQEKEDLRFGNLVDCLAFTPNEFDDRYITTTAKAPSGLMLDFVNKMYELTLISTNEEGILCRDLNSIMDDSYDFLIKESKTGKLRDSLDKFKKNFVIEKKGWEYYQELKSSSDKLVVTSSEVEQGNNLVDYLYNHPYTSTIFNKRTGGNIEVINQKMVITEIEGLPIKLMADMVHIDHDKKEIDIYDLKVMGNIAIFPYNYKKLYYYIQNANYTTGIMNEYPGYKVNPIKFITVDKYRYMDPLVVRTTSSQYNDAMNGFIDNDRHYPGLKAAIDGIKFHRKTGIWTSSKKAQLNNGIVTLELHDYDESE